MVRMLTACTEEIDDVELAVEEILGQLDLPANQLKNTVGMLTCYSEFIDTGVVAALCGALPFDVAGATTMGNAVPGCLGQLSLTLSVLTSDDATFSTTLTPSLTDSGLGEAIAVRYPEACAALGGEPRLAIAFAPLLFSIGGDIILKTMASVSGDLPVFGTLAVDHTTDYSTAQVICNGQAYKDRLAVILVAGDITPTFFLASVAENKILRQRAVITASQDNLLIAVNNTPALDYMEGLGLVEKGNVEGLKGVPFLIDYGDGTKPVVRNSFGLTPEGNLVFGGSMPAGTTLGISSIDYDDVIGTTRELCEAVAAHGKKDVLLLFSCIGRNFSLNFDTLAELQTVEDTLGGALPYQMAYAGGEFCPMPREDGSLVNRFHNDTIIGCAF